MITEFVKGISIEKMIEEGLWTKEWQQLLEEQFQTHTLSCIERGWVPRDLKSAHVFWCENMFRWIDYGKYMKVETFKEWIESDKLEDIIAEIKKDLYSDIELLLEKKQNWIHIA